MPNLWHFLVHRWTSSSQHRRRHRQRKLEDGLFQIASHTCSLLVQVNNTNNITFGDNATNVNCTNIHNIIPPPQLQLEEIAKSVRNGLQQQQQLHQEQQENLSQDQEQLVVLIPPPSGKARYKPAGTLRKPRLSTVLEGPVLSNNDESDLWNNGYILPADHDNSPIRRWGNKKVWCRPSCIPITVILLLIFLVVLLPLLDHATEKALQKLNAPTENNCQNSCSLTLVESIPEGLIYPNNTITNPSTYTTWMDLIENAQSSIDIASLYWTLRQDDVFPDPSSKQGQDVFDALLKAGTGRGIKIRIAQNAPTRDQPNTDTTTLAKRKAAEVRSLNFAQLIGEGVLHTKLWIIDKKHFYLGSANMDWRALTQVKEMGVVAINCSCLTEDISKIFDVYWTLGKAGASVPDSWPDSLDTQFNMQTPMNLTLSGELFKTYLSSSPPQFSPLGRTNDIDAIVNLIEQAEKFIYIAVMDYFPLMIYTHKIKFWPVIDNALRTAAINEGVEVRMLISWWNHSRTSEDYFLKSLMDLTDSYPKVSVNVRRFIVPSNADQSKIPFARVNHNKYMVTDNTAYIGTSNWSGDYFVNTAGIGLIVNDPVYNRNASEQTLRSQLQEVFERDWNSNYSHPL